jgi:transposase
MPKPGPRTTYQYSDAFKATAVRLSQLPEVAVRCGRVALHPPFHVVWLAQAGSRGSYNKSELAHNSCP